MQTHGRRSHPFSTIRAREYGMLIGGQGPICLLEFFHFGACITPFALPGRDCDGIDDNIIRHPSALNAATKRALGSFGLRSLQGIISLSAPILQHLNVGPRHQTVFHHLSGLTTLLPKLLGEKCFQVASRSGVLLGSSRKLALCGRSVHAAPLSAPGHRLPFGLELLEQPTATLDHSCDRPRLPFRSFRARREATV